MAYHQTSEFDHGAPDRLLAYIAIGEVRSEQDAPLAKVTLFKLGIPYEIALGGSEVDAIRRFLGNWSTGQLLYVKPQDATRALAAVGHWLEPTQVWTDKTLFLERCSTEQLFKLLDFREIWREPWEEEVLRTAERVLASRGIDYPPDGTSRKLPVVCLIAASSLGLYAFFLHWRIQKMRPTKEGGSRPRYSEKTRRLAWRRIHQGLVVWLTWMVLLAVVVKARAPQPKGSTPTSQQPARGHP
ncbi:MAG: hypothetical protein ACYC67_11125 [Prosthecobacter sp.]